MQTVLRLTRNISKGRSPLTPEALTDNGARVPFVSILEPRREIHFFTPQPGLAQALRNLGRVAILPHEMAETTYRRWKARIPSVVTEYVFQDAAEPVMEFPLTPAAASAPA